MTSYVQSSVYQQQISLISSKYKQQSLIYEVQREGLIYLRRYRNKKFRIIFNIIPLKNNNNISTSIKNKSSIFNKHLLNKYHKSQQGKNIQNKQKLNLNNLNIQNNNININNTNIIKQQKQQNKTSYLTILTDSKQLQDNRIIIIMNGYLNIEEQPKLVILAYLISSLIFYHNWNQSFSQSSYLTQLFCSFGQLLKHTDIDKLNQNIKFKTGYTKTPYFMCLLNHKSIINNNKSMNINNNKQMIIHNKQVNKNKQDEQQQQQIRQINNLNSFYRFQSQKQNSKINYALQTMIDYFPQRSSIQIQCQSLYYNQQQITNNQKNINKNNLNQNINNNNNNNDNDNDNRIKQFTQNGIYTINKLGNQFQTNIVGRQLLNYQFTGTIIQNLLFQMCQSFNNNKLYNHNHYQSNNNNNKQQNNQSNNNDSQSITNQQKQNKQINLSYIYNKVIQNKKSRIQLQSIQLYLKLIQRYIYLNKQINLQDIQSLSLNNIKDISNRNNNNLSYSSIENNNNQIRQDNTLNSIFPISQNKLVKILRQIRQITIKQASIQALNCMNLYQYLKTQQLIISKINQYQQKLIALNHQLGNQFAHQCYQILKINQDQINFIQYANQQETNNNSNNNSNNTNTNNMTTNNNNKYTHTNTNNITKQLSLPIISQLVTSTLQLLTNKLQGYSNQCIQLFTSQDNNSTIYNQIFIKLIKSYSSIFNHKLTQLFNSLSIQNRQYQLQINQLYYKIKLLSYQNKSINQQYQLQLLIQAELKNKIQQLSLNQYNCNTSSVLSNSNDPFNSNNSTNSIMKKQSYFNNTKQYYNMKKHIQQLQQQVKDKNNHIQQLTSILQKFELSNNNSSLSLNNSSSLLLNNSSSSLNIYEKKPDKFNQQTKKLIAQANSKILHFYQILQQVKNIQKQYQSAKKSLLSERQKIINIKQQFITTQLNYKHKIQQKNKSNILYQEIIKQNKNTLQRYSQLHQTLKSNITQIQSNNAQLTCSLAQVQGEFQYYKKALTLVIEQYTKGKSQNLHKFYKFLQHQQLKQLLKLIIHKK